ncbi:MAG: CDP-alcohol phosphatidyltransferase family protein [Bryobacteraceae bacterium]|nr:CDP-alcohol phosphatidyltransferase family protein [Bryobacteraceae bacterium]
MAWLPNLLTCLRILLTPLIIRDVLDGHCEFALWLSLIAGLSDAADGFLARRFNWSSRLGAYLDPVADKFLLTGLYISFGISGVAPPALAWLVVCRDVIILAMVGGAFALTSIRDFPPSIPGKISTLFQITGALILLGSCAEVPLTDAVVPLTTILVAAATVVSGVHYIWRATTVVRST